MHMDWNGGPGAPFTAQPLNESTEAQSLGQSHAPADAAELRGVDRFSDRDDSRGLPARMAAIVAENHELRAEIERLRAERARMADVQNLMDVLGTKSPDRLVHDIRNVLNERELYRALADSLPD